MANNMKLDVLLSVTRLNIIFKLYCI